MLFRVYIEKELYMEKVALVKANDLGVALKDDIGDTSVLKSVYIADVDGIGGYITLRRIQEVDRD